MVLEGYKRNKKKLISPLNALPNLEKISYLDDTFPNVLWIALIYESKGLDVSIDLIDKLMQAVDKIKGKKVNGLMYEFCAITDKEWEAIIKLIDEKGLSELKDALSPLVKFYPECPFKKLIGEIKTEDDEALEVILKVGGNLDYKISKVASLSMGLFIDSLIKRQILSFQKEENKGNYDIKFLENNWESERAKEIRPSIRATMVTPLFADKTKRYLWAEYFWNRSFEIFPCDALLNYYELKNENKPIDKNQTEVIARSFSEIVGDIYEIHEDIFKSIKYSPDNIQSLEIKLGLFNRIMNLSKRLLRNFEYWNDEVGKMVLRSLIDSYLLLVWFQTKAKEEDLLRYRDYGLGKKKLLIEHLKSIAPNNELNQLYKELEEELSKELDSVVNPALLDVNVGDWKEKDTREIATEIGEKETYDYLYSPFSDIVHGGYSSLEQHHLRYCYNPLHKRHKIPREHNEKLDILIPLTCVRILIKALKFGKDDLKLSLTDQRLDEIIKLYEDLVKSSFYKKT